LTGRVWLPKPNKRQLESRRGLFIRADSASYKVVGMNVWFGDGGLRNDQTSATGEYNA